MRRIERLTRVIKTLNALDPAGMRLFGKLTMAFTLVLCVIPMFVGFALWDQMPDPLVSSITADTHEPLDTINKVFGIVVFPLLMVLVTIIAAFVGRHRERFNNVNDKLMYIVTWLPCMMSFTMCGTWYTYSLGMRDEQNDLVFFVLGIIFMCIGVSFLKVYRNWRYGYRTPYAMGGENNWRITQTTAGILFIVGGFASCFEGLWFIQNPTEIMTFVVMWVVTVAIVLIVPYPVSIIAYHTVPEDAPAKAAKEPEQEKKQSYKKTKISSNSGNANKGNAGVQAIKAKKKKNQ